MTKHPHPDSPPLINRNTPSPCTDIAKLLARFHHVRAKTEALAAPIPAEEAGLQSMPDASPVKWHLAHASWFFETFLLAPFEINFTPFHADYKVLFNSYYNGVGNKHPRAERGLIGRPNLADVLAYRANITARITQLLQATLGENKTVIDLMWLGCNHEEQHQELILTDVKHLLSKNPAKPAYQPRWPLTTVKARRSSWIRADGGLVEIGHDARTNNFAFDNESPRHKVWLEPFEIASQPVTHGEFLAFVEAGGYAQSEWWLSLGWDWVTTNRITAPMYWEKQQHGWRTFTLHGMMPIEPNTPICHVNYFEADAYARWVAANDPQHFAGARLPREAEWEFIAAQFSTTREGNFLESDALHPLALRDDKNHGEPQQMFGDVWEWTQSSYAPYPGFSPAPGAVGEYNGKFMCNQYVLRGGSCATPYAHIRASYRNFFPADARWQFSGLRLARDTQ
jgi:ergothioneine biosynthesis protein EgtB